MKHRIMFWVGAATAAGSFMYGLIKNSSWSFIISWGLGMLGVMVALGCAIVSELNKRK